MPRTPLHTGPFVLLALVLSIALTSSAQPPEPAELQSEWFPEPYLDQQKLYVLPGPIYGIFTHNSQTWDSLTVTLYPTIRLNQTLTEKHIPTISLVEDFQEHTPDQNHYLREWQITYPILSSDGHHSLLLPGARAVFMSGGYLEHCLARAIQAVVDGTKFRPPEEPLLMVLVTDAIYMAQPDSAADKGGNNRPGQTGQVDTPRMSSTLREMSDEAVVSYLTDVVLDERHGDQGQSGHGQVRSDRVNLRLFRDRRWLDTVGGGPFTIDVVLVDTETLEDYLPDIIRWTERDR